MTPHWTPELVTKSPIEDFAVYEDRIYAIFRHDFIDSHPSFDGLRVSVRRQKEETDGKMGWVFPHHQRRRLHNRREECRSA